MLGETRTTKYRPPAVGMKRKSQWFHRSAASVFVIFVFSAIFPELNSEDIGGRSSTGWL